MIVRPAPGLTIIRPDTNQPLAAGGADVPDQDWCLRRLRDGDVLQGYAAGGGTPTPTPTPVPTPTPTPVPTPTPTGTGASLSDVDTHLAGLPTTMPSSPGKPWNNGGVLSFS